MVLLYCYLHFHGVVSALFHTVQGEYRKWSPKDNSVRISSLYNVGFVIVYSSVFQPGSLEPIGDVFDTSGKGELWGFGEIWGYI